MIRSRNPWRRIPDPKQQMPMDCAREVLDERPRQGSSPDEGREAPAVVTPLWADVPADILGAVLRLLPCAADRASVRSVCPNWRAAARVQAVPAPLPVLVLPRFRFSCLISDESLTVPRPALMFPVELAGDDVQIVGSCDEWVMATRPSRSSKENCAKCFLEHAFSREVVYLPSLRQRTCSYNLLDVPGSVRHIQRIRGDSSVVFCSALLSASPSLGSKYIVAALCRHKAEPGLALWQRGMTSWYCCRSSHIDCWMGTDFAFYQGKLYMVWKYTPNIFAFEIREDKHGVSLSLPEQYNIDGLITPSNSTRPCRCNIVAWHGKLLLIIRFFSKFTYRKMECKPHNVEVFALDFSLRPCGFTQIHNFDGDCIFVDTYGCRPFSPGLHVGVHGDLIYFYDDCISDHFPYVYNMKDGTVRLADGLPADGGTSFPIWIFPS